MTSNRTKQDPATDHPALVLVPGHWLGAWAWDDVVPALRELGHAVTALTLPGLEPDDPDRTTHTLDEQAGVLADAVRRAAAHGPVVLVVHSGGNYPATLLLDRHPDAVTRVVYVDSGPAADGAIFDAALPDDVDEVPLPDFEVLAQKASLEGIDAAALQRFRDRSAPQPGPIMRERISLHDDRRLSVPTTIIASSFPSQVMMTMAREGHPMMAETARLTNLTLVDLPTGHWPMWSRPDDLAAAISKAAGD
ncbi:alpha/beta fold hydrolase [Nocardia alni]|uniref:alpha/beta fold hydrolase n=1 Tax=Nocardia alni TaxID=2815723 RepID=UPI001C2266CA|nr:alpha/beta hydrolase [Nocardia alni]